MTIRRTERALAGVLLAVLLSSCGGGDGGGSTPTTPVATTPTPAPPSTVPVPAPTPAPAPAPTAISVQAVVNQPPVPVFLAMLLTDGSVMVQADPQGKPGQSAGDFYKLTPDNKGDYSKGTWTHLASPPAGYAPYASSEVVLADGRVLFVGGEYNQDNYGLPFAPSGLTNMSAVYDPVANSWTMIAAPPGQPYIGDVPGIVLPDGRFVFGSKLDKKMWALDSKSLTWSAIAQTGKADNFAEEGFTLLPSGDILTVDMVNTPQSEQFVVGSANWLPAGSTQVSLTSPTDYPQGLTYGPAPVQTVGGVTYGPGPTGTYFPPGEIGPAILRPDGTVFATGSAVSGQPGHSAIYHPSAASGVVGTWSLGPDFPNLDNAGDSSAALLINGSVLVAGNSGALYEYDGTALKQTVKPPTGANGAQIQQFLLPLPTGQVLVLAPQLTTPARLYTPTGSANTAWAPTITSVPNQITRGQTYQIGGTQFNGLSQATAYGDELNTSTNYPIVRLTNVATGHIFFARTHGHSTMAVATGTLAVTSNFDVPAGAETGATTLVVIANGIASAAVSVTVG